jgi:site-specific DNA recombinase
MSAAAPEPATSALACYLRVSSEHQRERGTIEDQRRALDRYLAVQAITPCGWYEDPAWSGYAVPFASRPDGARLMADIRVGAVGLVLVTKLDRFGRNAREILNAVHDLEAAGARLISLKENVDTRTSAGRFFLTVLAGVAELERDLIAERTSAGAARRVGEGRWMGGRAPYGYRLEGRGKDSRLVVDEDMAAVVRRIYALTVDDNWPCQRIADVLNAEGVPTASTRRGERFKRGERDQPALGIWRENSIRNVLTSPIYQGEYHYGRHVRVDATAREVVPVPDLALVDAATWDAAQVALRRHLVWSRRNATHDYLLRGLIRCALCGHAYAGEPQHYVCTGKRRAAYLYGAAQAAERRCQSVGVRVDWIEGQIWQAIEGYLRDPGATLALVAARLRGQADQSQALRDQIAHAQAQQQAKQAEKDTVIALFRRGRIAERDLDRQLDAIAAEEAQLADALARLVDQAATVRAVEERLVGAEALLERLRGRLDAGPLTPATRRELVEALVREVQVDAEPVGTTRRGHVKRRPVVTVVYCFTDPANGSATGGAGATADTATTSAWHSGSP